MKNEIDVNMDMVLASLWNAYIEGEGYGNKIYVNDADFFANTF